MAADCFTKWVEVYGIPNQEAVTVAVKLVAEMFCRFSPPEQVHSDQGRQFELELLKQICNLLQIKKTHTRPQRNGIVERFNRTLQHCATAFSMQSCTESAYHDQPYADEYY